MIRYQNENFGGSFAFRCNPHDGYVVLPHIHEYSEILYTTSGCMQVNIRGEQYDIPAGSMAFILPNEVHAYTGKTGCHVICAVFSSDFVPAFFRRIGNTTPQCPVVDIGALGAMAERLPTLSASDTVEISGILNLLCARLLSCTALIPRPSDRGNLYRAATVYISQNFRSDITLRSMAAALGYHEKYLSSALHALTGMHFCRFLSSYRVEYARRLLHNPAWQNRTVAEIAHDAGFSSLNTFCREFRELSGMTATEYRLRR